MGFPLSRFIFMPLLFLLSQLHLSSPFMQPLCHRDDSSALLQFKKSFIIDEYASCYGFFENDELVIYYPFDELKALKLDCTCQKVASWTVEGDKSDCCSWDGVECDKATGHVIGLDLSASCLEGSINSNSSLFRLIHLQSLNLAFNNFNSSQIPSQVRDLSRLTHLNLSSSNFFGQIPLEISQLSHLSSLDLSSNNLELKNASLRSLVGNLTHLQKLDLTEVHIGSMIPNILANLSSLMFLSLHECGLYGEFPVGIFKLSNLRFLSVHYNEGITGYLPSFTWNCPLEKLHLSYTNFSGELPASMGNLGFLTELDISGCNFSGSIPSSLGNLTNLTFLSLYRNAFVGYIPPSLGNLTKLVDLYLASNTFVGNIPPSLGNLVQLSILDIAINELTGSVPFELVNLPQLRAVALTNNLLSGELHFGLMNKTRLEYLYLSENRLTGPVTFGPMNLTQLYLLDLSNNSLHGQISNSIFNLKNLRYLDLSENYFNGIMEFDEFVKLKYLTTLVISGNQLSLLTKETNANATLQKFELFGFSSCNLSEFPNFLRNQDKLLYLNLSNNNIHGQVPEWMWNTSTASLEVLDLSNNSLTSFGQHPIFLPWTSLDVLDLTFNLLQGSLPIPPVSTRSFYISNNLLTGNVPELFCNLSYLEVLDLANNNLSGSLPRCLNNFGASLSRLDLQRNNFQGSIPETWTKGNRLSTINFSRNKFQGRLPRSLAESTILKVLDLSYNQFVDVFPSWLENLPNLEVLVLRSNKFQGNLSRSLAKSTMLKILDLSDNKFIDIFPFWLGHLPNLRVLILRSNKFNGPMETLENSFKFPNMQILDISYNDFIGKLPLGLFENWKARNFENVRQATYIDENSDFGMQKGLPSFNRTRAYTYSMTVANKGINVFYEKVPTLFRAIDFSNNRFDGEISESIGNLRGFHLLNLSNNYLTGHIPSSLGNLIELEALDLSHNNLSGEIPQQLTQLTFLEFFNVSHNNLTGLIPQGKQFDTFENNSFEGNPGLCGRPLTRKCENSGELPSQHSIFEESQDSKSPFEFGWKIVVIGYGFGFVVGVIIGQIVIARKRDWLMKALRIRLVSGRRRINK